MNALVESGEFLAELGDAPRELRSAKRVAVVGSLASATRNRPHEPLDSTVLFAPAGEIVSAALEALDRGGTLAIAGIHLDDIPSLRYGERLMSTLVPLARSNAELSPPVHPSTVDQCDRGCA